jgi:Fic family protein
MTYSLNSQIRAPGRVKSALVCLAGSHYQFETIPPFLDGNGRMGRLLVTLQLQQSKLMAKPVLYLSDFFERNRMEYYQALERVGFTDSLDHWLRFFSWQQDGVLLFPNPGASLAPKQPGFNTLRYMYLL